MHGTLSETPLLENARKNILHISRPQALEYIGIAAIVLLGAGLLFTNLQAIGYANTYYTAAVKAMLQSWHNFFFVAAEPGGSVTLDKPPVGFWLEAISAFIFGVNGFAVVLPQILAALGSIVVLYHLIRRKFGVPAGLLAALALAITPVVVATARNNTIDTTLVFALLLAAWAFIKATESGKLRYLLLGAFLVGIGFNIKMLEAYLPLPAFYALYFFGSAKKFLPKVGALALASILLIVVSFSWATIVDLTPASQRPYIGSSGDNSEISLIFGYNGVQRLLGMFGRRGASTGNILSFLTGSGSGSTGGGFGGAGNYRAPVGGGTGGFDGRGGGFTGGGGRGGLPAGGGGVAGGFDIGQPGLLRLFTAPLNNEASWLLPLGILGALLVLFRNRIHWPLSSNHQDLILWGGWLLTVGVFFSVAGFFHQYYLTTMAPPLAALVAIGAVGLWQVLRQRPWLGFGLLLTGAGGTLFFQAYTAQYFTRNTWWLPFATGLLIIGGLVLAAGMLRNLPSGQAAGFACILAATLVTPGIWSGLTNLSSGNQTLPAAYSGTTGGFGGLGGGFGGDAQVNQTLVNYLQQNTQGMRYLLAVESSQQGSGLVLATGRGVLYMGGFDGQDQVVTPSSLANLVATKQLRFIQLGGGFGGGSQSNITSWVTTTCKVAGTSPQQFGRGFGSQGNLYDCG